MGYIRQDGVRKVVNKVAADTKYKSEKIFEIIECMFESVAAFMEEDPNNAIYLRNLGTFYGNKTMREKVTINKKIQQDRLKREEQNL